MRPVGRGHGPGRRLRRGRRRARRVAPVPDARPALGAVLRSDEFVPVAVHDGFHTFERGVVDEVSLVDLAAEVKAAFVAMLDAFQSTMLSQCDDLALEAGGDGGGDGAAAEGVLINFDD